MYPPFWQHFNWLWYQTLRIELSSDVSVPPLIPKNQTTMFMSIYIYIWREWPLAPGTPPHTRSLRFLYLYWHPNVPTIFYFIELLVLMVDLHLMPILLWYISCSSNLTHEGVVNERETSIWKIYSSTPCKTGTYNDRQEEGVRSWNQRHICFRNIH